MKPFNLQEYLDSPSRNVVTRDGRQVRIICTDAKCETPIVGLIRTDGEEVLQDFQKDGSYGDEESCMDLFFETKNNVGFVNLYREKEYGTIDLGYFHKTEEEALKEKYEKGEHERIATVKLEWEE